MSDPNKVRTLVSIVAVTVAATSVIAAEVAHARVPPELTGWWITIDEVFPSAWQRRRIAAMEEILIVGGDGRVENRVMNFHAGSPQVCAKTRVCSDLPLIAVARLRLRQDRLSFVRRHASRSRLDTARNDALIRRLAVTATRNWTIKTGKNRLTLRAGKTTRILARIDPDRLRRLRAGLRATALPPRRHWRCFLANATAGEMAFAQLRKDRERKMPLPPNFLARYLKVASYLAAIESMLAIPTADDPDEKTRHLIGHATEELMIEHFDDIRLPASMADKRLLQARSEYLRRRGEGASDHDANFAIAYHTGDVARKIAPSETDILAFAKALSNDAAAKKLFCRK